MKIISVAKNFIKSERKALAMKQEPAIAAAKKAYRQSFTYQVDRLLQERSRWQRKVTIASNKLADVDKKIRELACAQAYAMDKSGVREEAK